MKILVIRFSSIGDIVLTTPVLRCLRQQTGAEVHFLTKSAFASIVEPNPYVERVFSFQKSPGEVLTALRREYYDLVVDLHHNLRSFRVKWALGRPSRSFEKLNWEKWLAVNLKINRLPPRHIVDRYLDTVRPQGVVNDGQGLDFFIPSADEAAAAAFLQKAGLAEKKFAAIALGAAHGTKRMPSKRVSALSKNLQHPIVLLGGKAEALEGEAIAQAAGPHVRNACGLLSLGQSAAIVREAALVLTPDTGMMHIAAAFRRPMLSVWGNTIPEFGMEPYLPAGGSNLAFEVKGLGCRPCSKIGFRQCPRGHFDCMEKQDWERMRGAMSEWMG